MEIEMAEPDLLAPGRHYTPTGMYTYQKPGTVALVDFDDGAFHRGQPITPEHVQSILRRISGADVTVAPLKLASTWTTAPAMRRLIAAAGCCWLATPPTSIRRWAARD